jgi:hypothetical protein
VAYHAFLFTRINAAGWLFALMFAVQAALFSDRTAAAPGVFLILRSATVCGPHHMAEAHAAG